MSKMLLRPLLFFVVLAAGLKVVIALDSGFGGQRLGHILIALFGGPTLLVAFTAWLAPSKRRRHAAMRMALGTLLLSLSAGALGLIEFVSARANDVPSETALRSIAMLRDTAGVGLCAAALSWGVVCAANIFGATSNLGSDRAPSEPTDS